MQKKIIRVKGIGSVPESRNLFYFKRLGTKLKKLRQRPEKDGFQYTDVEREWRLL